ncbi:MAG TPA: protoporphyrinogen oxidase [Blastocatellia bacterium]|nr:protoporphyrinogen oxidase [Blastocatellia bacterium]
MKRVIIIGSGISGLITAYRLKQAGIDVNLLERADRVGGVMRTTIEDGFLTEWGPNSFRNNDLLDDLISELGLENEKLEADPAAPRFIYQNGKLKPFPMGLGGFISTSLLTIGGKLRILAEPFIKGMRNGTDESVAGFITRRLGPQIEKTFVSPFVSGIYAGDSSKLSMRSTFAALVEFEEEGGSITRGAFKAMRRKKSHAAQPARPRRKMTLTSFKHGIGVLPNAIAENLGDSIELNCSDINVEKLNGAFSVSYKNAGQVMSVDCNAIVMATPAFAAAGIVRPLSATAADALDTIPYPPVVVVSAAIKKDQTANPVNGFGFLIPRTEGLRMLGCVWSSSLFSGRAPEGFHLVTMFFGGATDPGINNLDDDAIRKIVTSELRQTMNITGDPGIIQIIRHSRAIPQYNIGHSERARTIEGASNSVPGLFFACNYLDGVSAGDCAKRADKVVHQVSDFLT